MEQEEDFLLIEDRDIYDGWCAKINIKTKELIWRDAWFTKNLDKRFRDLWEYNLRANNPEFKILESEKQ